jgi:hypothetical protein
MRLHTPPWLFCGLAWVLSAAGAVAQGTFQNLGFELAALAPVSGQPPFYYFVQAFPGWTGYVGGVQEGLTVYNQLAMSTAGFSIVDTAYRPLPGYGSTGGLIQGSYTAVLMSGVTGVNQSSDATIAQTGLVPAGTESLRFKAQFAPFSSSGSFGVTLGGQALSLIPVASGTNYTLYAADIHTLAGQTAELNFTVFAHPQQFASDYLFLDSIQFSNQPVPEPGAFALSALGALLLGWRALARWR